MEATSSTGRVPVAHAVPTKPAIATRPCLISAWRRKPIVASFDSPQNLVRELERIPKPITGFSSFASASRSDFDEYIAGAAARDDTVLSPAAGA